MAEKKLPDITRRQFLKGAAKVAGATALPGSGLASIGEAVKMGLDINQKLDLTKNILQGLTQNELTPRELRIFMLLKNFTTDGGLSILDNPAGLSPLDKIKNPEKYKKKVFKQITENRIPSIIGGGTNHLYKEDLLEAPTIEEINTVLQKQSNQTKLLDAVTEYNLPFNAIRKTNVQDETLGEVKDGGFLSIEDTLKNFSNIKNKFLQEYKDKSSPVVEYFKKTELLRDIENKIKKKYNLNDVDLQDILPSFNPAYNEDFDRIELMEETDNEANLKRILGLNFEDLKDPLFDEYDNLKEDMYEYQGKNLYQKGDNYDHTYHNSFDQRDIKDALDIGKDVLDFALDQGQKYVGKKLYEKLRPGEQQQPPTKRLPEPEAIEVEVQDKKEIPVQAEQEAPVPPGSIKSLITKGVKRSPLMYLLTPSTFGDAELNVKDKQGNLIPRKKGGPVIRNYNNNYNTQRTI